MCAQMIHGWVTHMPADAQIVATTGIIGVLVRTHTVMNEDGVPAWLQRLSDVPAMFAGAPPWCPCHCTHDGVCCKYSPKAGLAPTVTLDFLACRADLCARSERSNLATSTGILMRVTSRWSVA
jgi:hypothetical protein